MLATFHTQTEYDWVLNNMKSDNIVHFGMKYLDN